LEGADFVGFKVDKIIIHGLDYAVAKAVNSHRRTVFTGPHWVSSVELVKRTTIAGFLQERERKRKRKRGGCFRRQSDKIEDDEPVQQPWSTDSLRKDGKWFDLTDK
jgi:hypothetical protein